MPVSERDKFGDTGRSNVFSKYQGTEADYNDIQATEHKIDKPTGMDNH